MSEDCSLLRVQWRNIPDYPNATTLRLGLCYRKSVCRLYRSCAVITGLKFRQYFFAISYTLVILWPPCKILGISSQGNPSVGGVKRKMGGKIERCHVPVFHLLVSSCFFIFLFFYWTQAALSMIRDRNPAATPHRPTFTYLSNLRKTQALI